MLKSSGARVGESINQIDTPALIMDLNAFEKNNALLFSSLKGYDVRIRPHAKSHKCPEIAKRQIALGAIGICCQKVSEAQAFADAGIEDILVANEVVGEKKIAALVALAKQSTMTVCVDHADNAKALNAQAAAAGIKLNVLIEIDVGAKRCGIAPGEPALALAKLISSLPALSLKGLQAYHGPAQRLSAGPPFNLPRMQLAPLAIFSRPMALNVKQSQAQERAAICLRPQAGCLTRCSQAPTFLWMPITPETIGRATICPSSSTACLSWPR